MADIFNEVDEEVRRERLKQLWDRYGIFIIGLAVLLVVGYLTRGARREARGPLAAQGR